MLSKYSSHEHDYYQQTSRSQTTPEKKLDTKEKTINAGSTITTQNIDTYSQVEMIDGQVDKEGMLVGDSVKDTMHGSKITTASKTTKASVGLNGITATAGRSTETKSTKSTTTETTINANGKMAKAPAKRVPV